jgi:hypothetical protein
MVLSWFKLVKQSGIIARQTFRAALVGEGRVVSGSAGMQNMVVTGFPLMTEPLSLAKMGRAEAVLWI